jgi:hypothetical protein
LSDAIYKRKVLQAGSTSGWSAGCYIIQEVFSKGVTEMFTKGVTEVFSEFLL